MKTLKNEQVVKKYMKMIELLQVDSTSILVFEFIRLNFILNLLFDVSRFNSVLI